MRKVLLLVIVSLLYVSSTFTVHAAVIAEPARCVSPLFTHIAFIDAALSITSTGLSTCFGNTAVYDHSHTVELTVTLQRLTSGTWSDVTEWTKSGIQSAKMETIHYVTGGTYRVLTTVKVYNSNGRLLETGSTHSTSVTY